MNNDMGKIFRFKAKLIQPELAAIKLFDKPKDEYFPNAKFIYPKNYSRYHFTRLFYIRDNEEGVKIAFKCDNYFDIWINGKLVIEKTKHLQLRDVSEYIKKGKNNLHIRGYQTDAFDYFSSALTGGILIQTNDNKKRIINTDKQFKCYSYNNYYENEEKANFETSTDGSFEDIISVDVHPIALKRSFVFNKEFTITKKIKKAYFLATAYGLYEPKINEIKISDACLIPFNVVISKEYQKFEVTKYIKHGQNNISILLGNGQYNCLYYGVLDAKIPSFIGELHIFFTDGSKKTIVTDQTWNCYPSPLIDDDIQFGERYDSNLNIPLNKYGVKTQKCVEKFRLQNYEFVTKHNYSQMKFLKKENDRYYFDRGLIISGRVKLIFKDLKHKQKIIMRYAETLLNGKPVEGVYGPVYYPADYFENKLAKGLVKNVDVYISNGNKLQEYEPRFTYTGFRYVYIEGLDSLDQLESIEAFEIYNDVDITGYISSSNHNINRIYEAGKRTWLNNLVNGPTDCPTREKNYWNGDIQVFSNSACYLTDVSRLLKNWTLYGRKMHPGPYGWDDETYELPYSLYKFYNDKDILKKAFPSMMNLIKKRRVSSTMVLPTGDESYQYKDCSNPYNMEIDKGFYCGAYYIHMLLTVSVIAFILNKVKISNELYNMANESIKAFNNKYYISKEHDYITHSQAGLILALAFDITPKDDRNLIAHNLADYIVKNDYHLSCGVMSLKYALNVLADYGYKEVISKVILNEKFPSWLYTLNNDSSTFTEEWGNFNYDVTYSRSMCHYFHGSIIEFLFSYLGGIKVDEFDYQNKVVVIRPLIIKEIGDYKCSYKSKLGLIEVYWKYNNDNPIIKVNVPSDVKCIIDKNI